MLYLHSNYMKFNKLFKVYTPNLLQYEKKIVFITKRWMCNNSLTKKPTRKGNFIQFSDVIMKHKDEASRSIVVQVQSSNSYKELYSYCNLHGTVNQMLHYSVGVDPMHFIIVEFAKESDVNNVLSASAYTKDSNIFPTYSQFLWFKANSKSMPKIKQNKQAKLHVENGTSIMKENDLTENLKQCEDINDQIRKLYNLTKLSDIGVRLRFLVAKQVESALTGLFPQVTALPFGSSVNGYGRMGCDLDIVLRLNDYQMDEEASRLMFQCKGISGSERTILQRHMEVIGDVLQLFLPGCTQIRRILQARVPIIKYYQQFTDVECDLSMTNLSGVYMSEFLWLMNAIDDRVAPLVFTVRKWASVVGLTNNSPGRWITNFSLTLLVLFFLQRPLVSKSLLPTLNHLVKQAGKDDVYITEEGINCTFLRNIDELDFKAQNSLNLNDLLMQFFEYYSQFDFSSKAISLNAGIAITKPEHSALYIVNPLERELNVSKNVSFEELEHFKMEVRNAAWCLESQENHKNNWGILSLFDNKKKAFQPIAHPKHTKLIEVSKLFEPVEETNSNAKEINLTNKTKSSSRR